MTVRAFQSGHPLVYQGGAWRYGDTGELATVVRPCVRCGEMPTPEGHDACLGHLKGVTSACCGHGVEEPFEVQAK